MAIKKTELYSSLWESCNQLRGGMDASMYKDYVLVMLFLKYISDKYADDPYAPITIPKGSTMYAKSLYDRNTLDSLEKFYNLKIVLLCYLLIEQSIAYESYNTSAIQ